MKNLVICPRCKQLGTKSVLGEITEDGKFAILRFHRNYTTIKGNDFAVECGLCGEPTYIKKESESNGQLRWFAWKNSWTTIGTMI